jgi:Fe2+ or Zn2+ uptake regulation protein
MKKPATVREIYAVLHDKNINLTSIYRNLLLFRSIGIVFEEEFKKESHYYISGEHHHHIYCESCGYIECIPCPYHDIESPAFSFIDHNLILKGRCKKCAAPKE